MGRRTTMKPTKSHTLPSSPTHSSSSSDFEFTVSLSPLKSTFSSAVSSSGCPADDLFYKGQLLPLHLSPRLSMVRTLLLSSSSTSSSSTATSASRPSSGSSTDCDSSRPSSATADDDHHHHSTTADLTARLRPQSSYSTLAHKKPNKYFSLSRFSSVFKPKTRDPDSLPGSGSSVKRISTTARDVICKYLKKVKPLYEKLSQKQQQQQKMATATAPLSVPTGDGSVPVEKKERIGGGISYSFSGNLRYPRRRSCVSSCPSSMRSSPSHSGILTRNGGAVTPPSRCGDMIATSSSSSMEELQSAIQGAIAHCKNSMIESKNNEI